MFYQVAYPLYAERRCRIEWPGVGARIREVLHARGMKQSVLAERVGITRQLMSEIVRGHSDPRNAVVRAAALVLGTSIDYLNGLSDVRDVHREQREALDPARETPSLC